MPGDRERLITSRQNSWFRRLRRAMDRHEDEIVLEGPRPIADAIAAGWAPIAVAAREDIECSSAWPRPIRFDGRLFHSLGDTVHSQGLLALFPRPAEVSPQAVIESQERIAVALDGVQDPGNVGTIVRLAASFEASGIILLEGCADPWGPKAVRASAGTILGVPVVTMRAARLIAEIARLEVPLFAAIAHAPQAGTLPSSRAVVILGSEGGGISETLLAAAASVSIPISATVDSLNVAAAAAIILSRAYEDRLR